MSMHYITNVEILTVADDAATVRAMFFNPMTLPGMAELSSCGGYYHTPWSGPRTAGAAGNCAKRCSGSPIHRPMVGNPLPGE